MIKNLNNIILKNKTLKNNKQFTILNALNEGSRRIKIRNLMQKIQKEKEKQIINLNLLLKKQENKGYYEGMQAMDTCSRIDYSLVNIRLRASESTYNTKNAFERGFDLRRLQNNIMAYTSWNNFAATLKNNRDVMVDLTYNPHLKVKDQESKYITELDRIIHEFSIFKFAGNLEKERKKKKIVKKDYIVLETFKNFSKYDIRFDIETAEVLFINNEIPRLKQLRYSLKFKALQSDELNSELELQQKFMRDYLTTGILLSDKRSALQVGFNYQAISNRFATDTPLFFESDLNFKFKKIGLDKFFEETKLEELKDTLSYLEKIKLLTNKHSNFEKYKKRILEVNGIVYKNYMWSINSLKEGLNSHIKKITNYKIIQAIDYIGCLLLLLVGIPTIKALIQWSEDYMPEVRVYTAESKAQIINYFKNSIISQNLELSIFNLKNKEINKLMGILDNFIGITVPELKNIIILNADIISFSLDALKYYNILENII